MKRKFGILLFVAIIYILFFVADCINITQHDYCIRFQSIPGVKRKEFRRSLPEILYNAWPGHQFTENCSSPDRITIHSRNRNFTVKRVGIEGRFSTGVIALAYPYGKMIILNNAYLYSLRTRILVSEVSEPHRQYDWCFINSNESFYEACSPCRSKLGFYGTTCKLKAVGINFIMAHEIGHVIGHIHHTATGIMRRRLRELEQPIVTTISDLYKEIKLK